MSLYTTIIDFLYYKRFNVTAEFEITHNNSIFKFECGYEKEYYQEDDKFFNYNSYQRYKPRRNLGDEYLFPIKTETKPKNISWESYPKNYSPKGRL